MHDGAGADMANLPLIDERTANAGVTGDLTFYF
jgi:hypothetical protein